MRLRSFEAIALALLALMAGLGLFRRLPSQALAGWDPALLKLIGAFILSVVMVVLVIWILRRSQSQEDRNAAYTILGTVMGYWFTQAGS